MSFYMNAIFERKAQPIVVVAVTACVYLSFIVCAD